MGVEKPPVLRRSSTELSPVRVTGTACTGSAVRDRFSSDYFGVFRCTHGAVSGKSSSGMFRWVIVPAIR